MRYFDFIIPTSGSPKMRDSLLDLSDLGSTRATTPERSIGASFWPEVTTVQNYRLPESVDTETVPFILPGSLASDFGRPKIQIVFSPEKQDTSIRAPEGADLSVRLRNRLVHGVVKDHRKLLMDMVRTVVADFRALQATLPGEPASANFRRMLLAQLQDEPIEDGVTHPGESLIKNALQARRSECLDWLSEILNEQYDFRPSLCASILRCIGRLEQQQVGQWGLRVVDHALCNGDVEVRDAAICALEKWGGDESLRILHQHHDTEDWLNDYVRQVIIDLEGDAS